VAGVKGQCRAFRANLRLRYVRDHWGFLDVVDAQRQHVLEFLGAPTQESPALSSLSLDPWNNQAIVAVRLVAHPGDHGSFGPLIDLDLLHPGDSPTYDLGCLIGHGMAHPLGHVGVIRKAKNVTTAPKSLSFSAWVRSRRRTSASYRLAYPSVSRSASSSARIR
jgi:hypothetical protein